MNFEYIEKLVAKCKNGDNLSKEKLAAEFRPFILNISKRTFIDRYELQDIHNECYGTLFKCVSLYSLEKHRFVAYATNAIKNNLGDLIKKFQAKKSINGNAALSFQDDVEKDFPSEGIGLEDLICEECDYKELKIALSKLSDEEKKFIDFVFYKNNTVQTYAYIKNMCYSTANQRKNTILRKILKSMD